MLVSRVQQSNSDIHTHTHIYTHIHILWFLKLVLWRERWRGGGWASAALAANPESGRAGSMTAVSTLKEPAGKWAELGGEGKGRGEGSVVMCEDKLEGRWLCRNLAWGTRTTKV